MTLIECFEKPPIENMISALAARPDKIIFIGEASQMSRAVPLYEKLLSLKYKDCKVESRNINRNNLKHIISVISNIIETEDDCIFDITGGEDLVLLGVGILYERYKNKKPFKMQRFNINTGTVIDCDNDSVVTFDGKFELTVKELISLYGGTVIPEKSLALDSIDAADIESLWEIVRQQPSDWNKFVPIINEFEHSSGNHITSTNITLNLEYLSSKHKNFDAALLLVSDFLKKLSKSGIINHLYFEKRQIKYTYKNALIKQAFSKAGDVLEFKCYFEAQKTQQESSPYFNDIIMKVVIDWDGIITNPADFECDTINEIDIMLMRGLIPVFVSCKNGKIGEEELYKLNTVAMRFGGKYAKKMLVATDIGNPQSNTNKAYINRAKDMGITLIPNAAKLTPTEWNKLFKRAFTL